MTSAGGVVRAEKPGRLDFVDFLRGVAVVEMLAAHYSGYFPALFGKVVDYTETAMPMFLALAGFIVGWGWRRFAAHPRRESRVLLQRALRIVAVQYIVIVTVGVPLYYLGLAGVTPEQQTLGQFAIESATFTNQIGIIHILPTFVPLFLVSPIILYALSRGWDLAVLICSAILFGVGCLDPYLLSMGRPTVFPFILVQSYFVIGCLVGKRLDLGGVTERWNRKHLVLISLALMAAAMLAVHGKLVPTRLFSIHPLNALGFVYQCAIMFALVSVALVLHPVLGRSWCYPYLTLFGRHALLAFTIHLYLAKLLDIFNAVYAVPAWINWGLVVASVVLMKVLVEGYEKNLASKAHPFWISGVHALFR